MAVTSAQAVSDLVDLLKTSPLVTGGSPISGKVKPFQRPLNSAKEDVVVNSLSLNREVVQKGMLNVNIYVPNEPMHNAAGVVDTSQPNMPRLTYLSQVASDFLSDYLYAQGRMSFEVQGDNILPDGNNQHYINLRVIFRAFTI